jgi:uncharacterized membrane protein YwzB
MRSYGTRAHRGQTPIIVAGEEVLDVLLIIVVTVVLGLAVAAFVYERKHSGEDE